MRAQVAGGEGWIIKVTVGIIILTMERASSTFFSSPPQKHRLWPFGTKNLEINGASTYNLFRRREGDLYQHDNFPLLRLMAGCLRRSRGEGNAFRCARVLTSARLCSGLNSGQKRKMGRRGARALWPLHRSPNCLIGKFACFPSFN